MRIHRSRTFAFLLILLQGLCVSRNPAWALGETSSTRNRKKAVVFFGAMDGSTFTFRATGVLIGIGGIIHILTAKHVVWDKDKNILRDENLLITANLRSGGATARSVSEIRKKENVDWIFHPNPEVDLAILPFPFDKEIHDVKVIPEEIFLTIDQLYDLYETFSLSYQPGAVALVRGVQPVIRSGTISRINEDKTVLVDTSNFPGNSGGPIFLAPSPIRSSPQGDSVSFGGDSLGGKFIGIVSGYIPYREVAVSQQTGNPRIIFEENSGLTRIVSVDLISEAIQSAQFQQQLGRLTGSPR